MELKDLKAGDKAIIRSWSNWNGTSHYLVVVTKKTATRLTVESDRITEATFTFDGRPYPRAGAGELLPPTESVMAEYELSVLRRKVKHYSWKVYDLLRSKNDMIEKLNKLQLAVLSGSLEDAAKQLSGETQEEST